MKPRIFFWVQHLLGIGHLRRAATLARHLAAGGFDVLLASGGAPVAGLRLDGVRFHQLPPLRAADAGLREICRLDGAPVDAAFETARRDALLALLADERPDIVLTEQFPFGRTRLRFELLPMLGAIGVLPRRPLVACSVRDVVRRAPAHRVAETVALIERHFDAVLIHGDPALVGFDRSFAGWAAIRDRAHYTGYILDEDDAAAAAGQGSGTVGRDGSDEVVVSIGGGAVGRPLLEAAVAARPISALADRRWRLLLGDNLPAADRAALPSAPGLVIEPARADFRALLTRATLSISQAGYNTVIETLRFARRAVLVPFGTERETEQADRASALAERGLVAMVAPGSLSSRSLADAIARALAGPALGERPSCDTGGGPATARLLHGLLQRRWVDAR